MKKTVHVITKYFFPVAAGIETNIQKTYGPMAKRGWNVVAHTSCDTHIEKNVLEKKAELDGMKVIRYPFHSFGYWPSIDFSKRDIVALHNFDVFPHMRILLYALWLKLIGRKHFTLVLTPHGGFNPEWRVFSFAQKTVKYPYHRTLGVLLINLTVDGVRAVSDWEKAEMIKWGIRPSKIETISNGIEDEALDTEDKGVSKDVKQLVKSLGTYIIQIGRVYPIKNYETTLKALSRLPRSVKYVIVGPISSVQYKEKLDKTIADMGLSDRVVFAGVIRGVDKYYIIRHAKAMVHMAIWESFCNVVHEGMSQGLPIIVANNTALPLLIKDGVNGFCVETFDHKTVAEKVNYILKDENKKTVKSMSMANRAFARAHTWSKVSVLMEDFYGRLAGTK